MSEIEASESLNEINKIEGKKPWYLTFSYGRALQASVLDNWKGNDNNIELAQNALLLRSKANGMASIGIYINEDNVGKSLYEKNYSY